MRLFRNMLFAPAVALASMVCAAAPTVAAVSPIMVPRPTTCSQAPRCFGKSKVFKRKRRPNRLHISRRVRRKHRRAA